MNENGICDTCDCIHIKCPICRKPALVDPQLIDRIVMESDSGVVEVGLTSTAQHIYTFRYGTLVIDQEMRPKRLKRHIEVLDDDLSILTIERDWKTRRDN